MFTLRNIHHIEFDRYLDLPATISFCDRGPAHKTAVSIRIRYLIIAAVPTSTPSFLGDESQQQLFCSAQ